jgi:hypothetical protein
MNSILSLFLWNWVQGIMLQVVIKRYGAEHDLRSNMLLLFRITVLVIVLLLLRYWPKLLVAGSLKEFASLHSLEFNVEGDFWSGFTPVVYGKVANRLLQIIETSEGKRRVRSTIQLELIQGLPVDLLITRHGWGKKLFPPQGRERFFTVNPKLNHAFLVWLRPHTPVAPIFMSEPFWSLILSLAEQFICEGGKELEITHRQLIYVSYARKDLTGLQECIEQLCEGAVRLEHRLFDPFDRLADPAYDTA